MSFDGLEDARPQFLVLLVAVLQEVEVGSVFAGSFVQQENELSGYLMPPEDEPRMY